MNQWVKELAAKTEGLSLIHWTQTSLKTRTDSDLHMCDWHMCTHTQNK